MLSDGTPWRPLINVQDMARAIEWAVERELHAGGDLPDRQCGQRTPGITRCAISRQCVADAIPGTEVSINREAPPDKRSYRVDFSLFRELAAGHTPVGALQQPWCAYATVSSRWASIMPASGSRRSCGCG